MRALRVGKGVVVGKWKRHDFERPSGREAAGRSVDGAGWLSGEKVRIFIAEV